MEFTLYKLIIIIYAVNKIVCLRSCRETCTWIQSSFFYGLSQAPNWNAWCIWQTTGHSCTGEHRTSHHVHPHQGWQQGVCHWSLQASQVQVPWASEGEQPNSPYSDLYTSCYLLWEKQVVNQEFQESLISCFSSYIEGKWEVVGVEVERVKQNYIYCLHHPGYTTLEMQN